MARARARIWAPIAVLIGLVAKFGFAFAKFASIFVAVGGYALIWGWKFAVGFVLLIFVHEMGHFIEARRRGYNAAWPVFIPFLGAYVAIRDARLGPWQSAWISLAGPITGGLGAAICWVYGEQQGWALLQALGYVGFMLNLFNLLPVGILDGGSSLARDQDHATRRHARQGERSDGRLLRARGAPAPRDGRRARPAAPAVMSTDRTILEHDEDDPEAHVAMIAEEFRMGFEAVDQVPRPAVTVFGSARIPPDSGEYQHARACGRALAEAGFAVVTGGGPGVMEAANRGAKEGGGYSVGFNIALPHEQQANPYFDLGITFRHFYARKVALVKAAEGSSSSPAASGRSTSCSNR